MLAQRISALRGLSSWSVLVEGNIDLRNCFKKYILGSEKGEGVGGIVEKTKEKKVEAVVGSQ